MNKVQPIHIGLHTDLIGQELKKADELAIKVKKETMAGKAYQKVLEGLLVQIQPVDFREWAEVNKDQKVPQKVYSVISSEEIIKAAKANNWGLATKHGYTYVYNGKYWMPIDANDFKSFLGEAAMKMGVPELEAKHHLFKEEMYKQILSSSYLSTPEPDKTVRINGSNGKSVMFEIVTAILGEENVCSYSLQSLTSQNGWQRAELSNKLLNYSSEINGIRDVSLFKQLVSGEPVEARQIYGKPFTMRDYGKLMFNCNALPSEVEQTHAYFRRIAPIPFTQTISDEEQDPELANKIIATELSGIWNWIMAGLHRLLANKRFTDAELVRNQVEEYRKSSDSVAMFIEEEGYKQTNGSPNVLLKFMYGDYKPFCLDNGYRARSLKTFAERLRTLSFQTDKTREGVLVYATK